LPTAVLADLASGEFGHAAAITIAAITVGYSLPWGPLVSAAANELPLPLGTFDGVLWQGLAVINAIPSIPIDVLVLAASVIDGVSSPADFPAAALNAATTRITAGLEALQNIIAAIGGALPLNALEFQTLAVEEEHPAAQIDLGTAELSSQSISSVTLGAPEGTAGTKSVTVDASAPADINENDGTTPGEAGESETLSEDESETAAGEDETPNGATDLSDGNMAQPGTSDSESTGDDETGMNADTEPDTTSDEATDAGTANADAGDGSPDAGQGE
jgi:hypothetical protein